MANNQNEKNNQGQTVTAQDVNAVLEEIKETNVIIAKPKWYQTKWAKIGFGLLSGGATFFAGWILRGIFDHDDDDDDISSDEESQE